MYISKPAKRRVNKARIAYLKSVNEVIKADSILDLAHAAGMNRQTVADCLRDEDIELFVSLNNSLDSELIIDIDKAKINKLEFDLGKTDPERFHLFLEMIKNGETNKSKLARDLDLSRMAVYSYIKILMDAYKSQFK